MKNILLTMAFAMGVISLSAQIKAQYQDEIFAQTTVVIKDDNTTDTDILDDQFDIDEIGMDQVIMITTQAEKPVVQKSSPVISAPEKVNETHSQSRKPAMRKPSLKPKQQQQRAQITRSPNNKASNQVKGSSAYAPAKASMGNSKQTQSRTRSSADAKRAKPSFNVGQYKKFKPKKRKNKHSKRNKRISCFSF